MQYFAYEKLKDAVKNHKAKAGSVIVLDAQTGEVLALANYPSYNPNKRVNLSGEQLRNRVLTDSFEPGSTMKPFIAALALDKGLVKMQRFFRSQNKLAYAYLLTPDGMAQKAELTAMFLRRKQREFIELKAEIDKLQLEVAGVVEEISL